jgi:isopentenyl-diphosphate delta-isomerase
MTRIIIVNNKDEIIGHKQRGTLARSDIYRVSALWVTNSRGDVLLAQRKFNKKHNPGMWGPAVAGTIDEGETYDSNIVKEAEEEIGLAHITPRKGPKYRTADDYNFFCQWYTLALDKPAEDFTVQEDEVEQIKWFTVDELQRELLQHPEKYLSSLDSIMKMFSPKSPA